MKIPERKIVKKKRGTPQIKNLCVFEGVRCWFDKSDRTLKFRPCGRKKKIESISVIQLYDKASGQLKLL